MKITLYLHTDHDSSTKDGFLMTEITTFEALCGEKKGEVTHHFVNSFLSMGEVNNFIPANACEIILVCSISFLNKQNQTVFYTEMSQPFARSLLLNMHK